MYSAKTGFIIFAIISFIIGIICAIMNEWVLFVFMGIGFLVCLFCAKAESEAEETKANELAKQRCKEYDEEFINSFMKLQTENLINKIFVFSSLYSGVPIEKMSDELKFNVREFVENCVSREQQYSEFKEELNTLIWNHLANENQLKEIDITTLPNESELMQYLNQQTIDATTSISEKTNLKFTEQDINKINNLVAKFIHKFITYEPMEADFIVMNALTSAVIVVNESNKNILLEHGEEFCKKTTSLAKKLQNYFIKIYKQEETIEIYEDDKFLKIFKSLSKMIDVLAGIDSADTTETNAVFEFYDAMEKECIKIINGFYKDINNLKTYFKHLDTAVIDKVLNKYEVINFFILDHYNNLRNNFYKISKEEQNKLINKFLQYGNYKKQAKTNCIPFLQDKILQVFQTNNFNNQYIYIYNDLTPTARVLRMLYEFVLRKGLETNVINENDYKELIQVLADTIKENKYM